MSLTNAYTVLYDSADVETGTATNPLRIDPTGTTTQPVSGTVTANQGTPAIVANAWPILVTDGVDTAEVVNAAPGAGAFGLVVRIAGTITTSIAQPATSTVTSVAVDDTVDTILASNANRLGAILWNDGPNNAFAKLGAAATTASFTVRLANKSEWEIPFPVYTGIITGICAATQTATVLATELTP
jgi:hypothetical protein